MNQSLAPQRRRTVELPANGWLPRADQMPIWTYLMNGGLRADIVAHRRFGKDEVALHWTAVAMHNRVGNYCHMLPEQQQARKAIWDAVNPMTGRRRIDEAFPKELRKRTLEDDMFIEFKNGSTWQVIGSDAYDRLVGTSFAGIVFSEWSLSKPQAWQYMRPILRQNGGWALFIWTPRGRNHATRAFEMREKDSEWLTLRLPATVTGVFTPEQLAKEKAEYIAEAGSISEGTARFEQEYLVSFDAPVPGAYYGDQMRAAELGLILQVDENGKPKMDALGRILPPLHGEKRVGLFPHDPRYPVETAWDLGVDDYTAIWFFQRIRYKLEVEESTALKPAVRIRLIDYYETGDMGFDEIKRDCFDAPHRAAYRYQFHHLPHDVAVRELGAGGRSRKQSLEELGIRPIRVGRKHNLEEGVASVRKLLPFCEFNEATTETGIDHLKGYSKKFNVALGMFVGENHNEHSHGADAFREIAYNVRLVDLMTQKEVAPQPSRWQNAFDRARRNGSGAGNWKTV